MLNFDEVIEQTSDDETVEQTSKVSRSLLLGNGFSIAASSSFDYKSLFDKMDLLV